MRSVTNSRLCSVFKFGLRSTNKKTKIFNCFVFSLGITVKVNTVKLQAIKNRFRHPASQSKTKKLRVHKWVHRKSGIYF